jgi:ribonuclease D
VRHLRNLYKKLQTELAARDRASWAEPELKALSDEKLYKPDPDNAWQRIRGIQRMKPKPAALMHGLAAWRERTAIAENRPRQWILKDEALMDMAKQQPTDLASLAAIRGVGDALAKRHGAELLRLLGESSSAAPERERAPAALTVRQDALVDALYAVLRLKAAAGDVSAASLANRAELERLVRGERELDILKDWRLAMAGHALLDFLAGKQSLAAGEAGLDILPR